ncbi:MAG: peroxide stress protein YaaA, partial [Flavobacteriales bacterium]|nr:peroxide stress protein YaaA [Flavobacteriales bacterium]
MIALLSPAKSLDFDAQDQTEICTQPEFLENSEYLVKKLRKISPGKLSKMMKINPDLAGLNHQRYQSWDTPFTPSNSKQALLAFRGDVYRGLAADTFSEKDLKYAQQHIRILSGLYGILKPL